MSTIAIVDPLVDHSPFPERVITTGIGGHEEWLTLVAHDLQIIGHDVTVYSASTRSRDVCGVRYRPLYQLFAAEPEFALLYWAPMDRKVWSEAMAVLPESTIAFTYDTCSVLPKVWNPDWVYLAFSPWHAQHYITQYKMPARRVHVVPLPVMEENDFETTQARSSMPLCIFASSPDRGLQNVVELWPRIRAEVPAARLMVTYADADALKRQEFYRAGIQFLGRLNFKAMKRLYHQAHLLLYPASKAAETFCYSVVKAKLAGCVPVAYPLGALADVVTPGGVLVEDADEFVDTTVALLNNHSYWAEHSEACRASKVMRPNTFAEQLERLWSIGTYSEIPDGLDCG